MDEWLADCGVRCVYRQSSLPEPNHPGRGLLRARLAQWQGRSHPDHSRRQAAYGYRQYLDGVEGTWRGRRRNWRALRSKLLSSTAPILPRKSAGWS